MGTRSREAEGGERDHRAQGTRRAAKRFCVKLSWQIDVITPVSKPWHMQHRLTSNVNYGCDSKWINIGSSMTANVSHEGKAKVTGQYWGGGPMGIPLTVWSLL